LSGWARKLAAAVAAGAVSAALAAPAPAAEPADRYNAPGQRHANVCVSLASPSSALRFGDGAPTGFAVDDQRSFDEDGRCPAGTVRLDLHELIPSSAGPLAFHRGGNGYVDASNVKYGHLAAGEIADLLPPPVPSSGGRGAPCAHVEGGAHQVQVRSIPASMHYKRPWDLPSGSNRGTSFEHYGDPGADQGRRRDVHYSYLIWSFLNVRGGGMVRTLLAPGQPLRTCDVDPVSMESWDRSGQVNGTVTARYVRVLAGSCPVYGWMVWSHDYFGDSAGAVPHATVAEGSPASDPAPDGACPVSPPGVPPTVTTEGAVASSDGAVTFAGTVNPHGVNVTYRFELGTDPGYGTATEPVTMSSADRAVAVSTQVSGLEPETTYHYRLVAEGVHGAGHGADRTLTTPPRLPPEGAGARLSGLAVRPGAFRRARSRRGAPARIRYSLSAPATVTLRFLRRKAGIRRGGACRPLRGRRRPRRARRCARWTRVGGSLRQRARRGRTSVRFGGWVRGRRLKRARYRVRGVADSGEGVPGRVRYGYFTLR
jgi:hypothetical protein